jgi:predicted RNA-binding Zn-ribbon protein involved in translation (DUF1610 family)
LEYPLSDRKYRQHGYQDREEKPKNGNGASGAPSKPRGETYGPRQMNMAPTHTVSRCTQCGFVLIAGAQGKCPQCGFDLHSCKQCAHFDPGSRFECRQPITARIARKDELNVCTFYALSERVERETSSSQAPRPAPPSSNASAGTGSSNGGGGNSRLDDARRAFDALFKK